MVDHGIRYTTTQKVQALTLLSEGFSVDAVQQRTGIPSRTANRIMATARKRGYCPEEDPRILEEYVKDARRPGRPKTITETVEARLLVNVRVDRASREKSSEILAYEVGIIAFLCSVHSQEV